MSRKLHKPFTGPIPPGFKLVVGTDQYYVSVDGVVASVHFGRWQVLRQRLSNMGYPTVCIYGKHPSGKKYPYLVHVLMLETFFGPTNGRVINHLDANPKHNSLFNLEYCTQSQNIKHAFNIGTKNVGRGVTHPAAKLNQQQVDEIRQRLSAGEHHTKIAPLFGVSETTIRNVRDGRQYGFKTP
jgi:hypothetical protein